MIENIFQPGEQDEIVKHYDNAFLQKVLHDLEVYSHQWKLSELKFVPYYSVNCIFTGKSSRFGDVVLKIGKPGKEKITECHALKEYAGRRFCRYFDADIDNGVLLIERIMPGRQLRDEQSLEKRLAVFCSVYENLHIETADINQYPTYIGWVQRITDYMSRRNDYPELFSYMKQAEESCLKLAKVYTKVKLLHGDLHHDNILLGSDGQYHCIDPKGVIGDPVFDIGRFILNEPYEEAPNPEEHVMKVVHILSEKLCLSEIVILQGFFIELTMGACWGVEDGLAPDEYPQLIKAEAFAKSLVDRFSL